MGTERRVRWYKGNEEAERRSSSRPGGRKPVYESGKTDIVARGLRGCINRVIFFATQNTRGLDWVQADINEMGKEKVRKRRALLLGASY